jgi:hypothetical protein
MHEQEAAFPGIFLDHDVPGTAAGDAMFIGKIGKILGTLNSNINIPPLFFAPGPSKA